MSLGQKFNILYRGQVCTEKICKMDDEKSDMCEVKDGEKSGVC